MLDFLPKGFLLSINKFRYLWKNFYDSLWILIDIRFLTIKLKFSLYEITKKIHFLYIFKKQKKYIQME